MFHYLKKTMKSQKKKINVEHKIQFIDHTE